MNEDRSVVLVVDDEPSALRAVERLLSSAGYHTETFASAEELLQRGRPLVPCCLVLDFQLPCLTGLDLQRMWADAGISVPIIFITGHGDISTSVRAMKAGAIDFLAKPFDEEVLLSAVAQAVARDRRQLEESVHAASLNRRYLTLTRREREVFPLVIAGMLNKQVGQMLGVTEKTVKVHRARVMDKMGAGSLVELVRMADELHIGRDSRVQCETTREKGHLKLA